jgi:hypothetical protein
MCEHFDINYQEVLVMNFKIERGIESGVFFSKVSFLSFGGPTVTAEEEEKMYSKFNFPEVDLGGSFKGMLSVVDGKVIMSETPEAEFLSFVLNSDKVTVDQEFVAEYRVNVGEFGSDSIGLVLDTGTKVAEARCVLFETEVIKRIESASAEILSKSTRFDEGYPIERTV